MSVKVEALTKIYGKQRAVDQLTFEAKPGEILGFLGPNGAGKTTTMKILTGYIPATEGKAYVCGRDVAEDALEARKLLGYLPEHNPLYKDMYVLEFLRFAARLYRIPNPKARIGELVELTGLTRERHKLIGALSKGYRQRVGLAQALLHDPEVLILDEPTTGLDPNQLAEIRELIRQLGKEKTLIFSTHIMQEVQAVCDRVLIINQGKLVADDSIDHLQNRLQGEVIVTAEWAEPVSASLLQKIQGVGKVRAVSDRKYQLSGPPGRDLRPEIFHFSVAQKVTLLEMHQETSSLESVFRQLTQSADQKEPQHEN